MNKGCKSPAIIPSKIAGIVLKINGALVPIMAAPAKVPYIRSLILILPYITADKAKEVTTDADIHQYALIAPLNSKNGGVVADAFAWVLVGISRNIAG